MTCPSCGGNLRVAETREAVGRIRRRRHCSKCPERFTTLEAIVPDGERNWHGARIVLLPEYVATRIDEALAVLVATIGTKLP